MPEFWIVYVPGEITQMNWMMHHTYSDAWSLGIVLRDLEALLEDADRDLPPVPAFCLSLGDWLHELLGIKMLSTLIGGSMHILTQRKCAY